MTLQQRLKAFGEALETLPVPVRHYTRGSLEPPFAVWAEDGEGGTFLAENRRAEPMIAGTLDYYTGAEFDKTVEMINELLEGNADGWELVTVLYEEDTKLIHYSWDWELGYG